MRPRHQPALKPLPNLGTLREAEVVEGRLYPAAKRATDILLAGIAIALLMPMGLMVALLIKLTDRGSVFFIQRRVGKNGVEFPFVKFRSMVSNAESMKHRLSDSSHHMDSITFKMKRDPRITWVGSIIRKTSIDELPQLWNVLKGEMSLVGPRPAVPAEVARYQPRHRVRLNVTPGLTCLWQINGRGDIPFEKQVAMDLQYIESRSWWFDMVLIVKTIPAVLTGRGAY